MSEICDETLFIAYCQGNSAAFEVLFQRYQYRLHQHLERMLNDHRIAEDLVVETFLRLHRHCHRYQVGKSVRAWVYTIARNLARDWLRRERIRRWLPINEADPAVATEAPSISEDHEIRRRVSAAFTKLPVRQREVCSLRLLEELSLKEIAKVVGVSLGTVKSRLFNGQRRLRDLLADLDPGKDTKG